MFLHLVGPQGYGAEDERDEHASFGGLLEGTGRTRGLAQHQVPQACGQTIAMDTCGQIIHENTLHIDLLASLFRQRSRSPFHLGAATSFVRSS